LVSKLISLLTNNFLLLKLMTILLLSYSCWTWMYIYSPCEGERLASLIGLVGSWGIGVVALPSLMVALPLY